MKKLLCFLILIQATPVFAQKYGSEFLSLGVGARGYGMGNAQVALANDVTAGYWNPAGLQSLGYMQVAYSHSQLFTSDINYDYAAFAMPFGGDRSFGFSIIRVGVDKIQVRDEVGNLKGIESASDYAFYFTYAKRFSDRFSYGINTKFITKDVLNQTGYGLGFDVGLKYDATDQFVVGANLQDITTTVISFTEGRREFLRPTVKLGAAYLIDWEDHYLTPTVEVDTRFEGRDYAAQLSAGSMSLDFHGGLEYSFKRLLFLRAGINDLGNFSSGTGFRFKRLGFDYSFALGSGSNDLGTLHRISALFDLNGLGFEREN